MLIWIQKISYITHFFLKMLQRNSKLVILDNLGMPGQTHPKWCIILKKPLTFISRQKNQLHPSRKFVSDTLGMSGYVHPKCYYYLVENVFVYLQAKINFNSPCFYEDIAKICKLIYLGYFWHAWLRSPKMVVSTCRRLSRLSACKK